MQDAALVECFIHGYTPRIEAAWAALGRVLPRLHTLGEGDFYVEASSTEDLEAAMVDLHLLGWVAVAPDVAEGRSCR